MTPYTIGYFAGMFDYRPGSNDTYPVITLDQMDDYPLPMPAWRVFYHLYHHHMELGCITNSMIAKTCRMNRKTVANALRELETFNLIITETISGHGMRVWINHPSEWAHPSYVENNRVTTGRGRHVRHRQTVLSRDNYQCVYCGSTDQLTLDHVVPVSRGGSDEIENLVACCQRCNSIKGARTPEEWLQATSLLNHHGV